MGSTLSIYACCITERKSPYASLFQQHIFTQLPELSEKDALRHDEIMNIIEKSSSINEIHSRLDELSRQGVITPSSWTEPLAEAILYSLRAILETGRGLSKTVENLYIKGKAAVDEWAEQNPEFARIVAIGAEVVLFLIALAILVEIMPWVIESLGFEALGPRLGSWAARWQSTYGGATPKGSVFSFLQRMGMTWGR